MQKFLPEQYAETRRTTCVRTQPSLNIRRWFISFAWRVLSDVSADDRAPCAWLVFV